MCIRASFVTVLFFQLRHMLVSGNQINGRIKLVHISESRDKMCIRDSTGTGKGSVNRKTQFGMMKSKPNKKYKCSCEDIQRKILVKYPVSYTHLAQYLYRGHPTNE